MNPTNPEIQKIWTELGEKHRQFHAYGKQALDALFDGDHGKAERIYQDAVAHSGTLLRDLEAVRKTLERV